MEVIKTFKGNSGCTIHLMNDSVLGNFIRKKSSNIEYNKRLLLQYNKQKKFNSNIIKTPKIFREGFINKLYYFDMEYVIGTKFSDYISQNVVREIYPHINTIINFIKSNNIIKNIDIDHIINDKVNEISSKTNTTFINDFNIKNISLSYCHGDLTFENIIINSKGDLYLIDFLDSFINTNLIDYSKILQDLIFLWSWRNENNKPYSKILLIQEYISKKISNEEYNISYQLMRLNLLRILPYIKKDNKIYNNILNFIKQ